MRLNVQKGTSGVIPAQADIQGSHCILVSRLSRREDME
jgi:hypothetical protein